MADEHRRVEPNSIVGTGMRTDPERIREVEAEHERVMRQRREKPRRGFGDVLEEAPAWHGEEEQEAAPEQEAEVAAKQEGEGSAPAPVELEEEEAPLPRVPPDPRVARLNQMLDKKGGER